MKAASSSTKNSDLRHVRDHVLWLRYSDGVEGEVDLGDSLTGSVLESLRDVSTFAEARIVNGHLTWPTGADWAPESLRERLGASYRCEPHSIDDGDAADSRQTSDVPEISRFYGIIIEMLLSDHERMKATYDEHEISVRIRDGAVLSHTSLALLG